MSMNTFLIIVFLISAGFLVLYGVYGLSKILQVCYNFCRRSRSKDEDVDSLEQVVVDHQLQHTERKNRRVWITDTAVMKHISPSCQTNEDAEIFSRRRNILSEAGANTVIKAQEWEFYLDVTGEFIRSNSLVPYWHCEKLPSGEFKVWLQITPGF